MKKLLLLFFVAILSIGSANAQLSWSSLASDASGDGSTSGVPDGTDLFYAYDDMSDSIFFQVHVNNFTATNWGMNIVLNVTGAGSTGSWWGQQNSTFNYNRLITAWISSGTTGTVGICDPAGAAGSNYTNIAGAAKIAVMASSSQQTYTVGMKRTDIYNSAELKANVIGAVGSNQFWNDDVPNTGSGNFTAKPNTTSIASIKLVPAFHVYPNPSNGVITVKSKYDAATTVQVLTITGATVYTGTLQAKQTNIDLSNLQPGNYFIKFSMGDKTSTKTITIQ